MKQFIVAEVSKNWQDGAEVVPGSGLLAEQFEHVIDVNRRRGYRLRSFDISRTMTGPDRLNETIIAVFELMEVESLLDRLNGLEQDVAEMNPGGRVAAGLRTP